MSRRPRLHAEVALDVCRPSRQRSPRRRSLLPERGDLQVAEELDLVAEVDAVLLVCTPASLLHESDCIRGARAPRVLDEVRVLRRDLCAPDPVALQPARLEHPPGGQLVLRILEDAAEGAPVRRLRRLAPG